MISLSFSRADLVACWLVWLLPKAQAEEGKGNTGEQGHWGEDGDGMSWTFDDKGEKSIIDTCNGMTVIETVLG